MSNLEVAAYYFGNYHADTRNEARYGRGWSEWQLLRQAKPRWPQHRQPIVPAWGYFDEADPVWMSKQIDLAADHGITTFLFDWYWYNDGPFLQRPLDEAFLHASNRSRLKFALMWANHNWHDIFPAGPRSQSQSPLLYPGAVNRSTWDTICHVIIDRYFQQDNYLRLDGKPYFSFFELHTFVQGLGGLQQAVVALDTFRASCEKAGLPGVHLNAMAGSVGQTVGVTNTGDSSQVIRALALDSVTDYVWVHQYDPDSDGFPVGSYEAAAQANYLAWDRTASDYSIPYYPNVTMGWDCHPRCDPQVAVERRGYPWTAVFDGNTPERFHAALLRQRNWAKQHGAAMVTLNAWNEWTEGSYLLPDTVTGDAYLKAVQAIYGS